MIFEVNSKNNARVKYAFSLHQSNKRKENNQFLAEGYKTLELALKANAVTDIFSLKKLKDIPNHINQYIVTEEIIDKIAFSSNPEGVVFICNMLKNIPSKLDKVIYLDHINDPGNMGTIIRTAFAFNYDAVIISEGSVSVYNEKTIAASKGSIFLMPILEGEITKYRSNQKIIVSTLSDKSIALDDYCLKDPFFLVLGNEAHGVTKEIINIADICLKIPMNNIDSLNVSIAAGILMYKLR